MTRRTSGRWHERNQHKENRKRWGKKAQLDEHGNPIRDENGKVKGVVVFSWLKCRRCGSSGKEAFEKGPWKRRRCKKCKLPRRRGV